MSLLDRHLTHVIVHTGQNYDYELNKIFFDELELRSPDHFLDSAGNTPCETVSNIIARIDDVLQKEKPEALLILGDTNSCLAAYPSKRRKIPVFHMEAGNRCFDERVPEEINRRLVDHISDINLPYSQISRQYLLSEGYPKDRIIVTGSPMFEVLSYYRSKIEASLILDKLRLNRYEYFVVSYHREENVDSDVNFNKFIDILNNLAISFKKLVIVTTHPRTRERIEQEKSELDNLVKLYKPFGFIEYVKLQMQAKAVLSDSGTITEESSILNFPAVNIREAHERPEGMEEGSVMLAGLNWRRIFDILGVLNSQKRDERRTLQLVHDYNVKNVSEKVLRIIMSYTDYVNRYVWRKKISDCE